MPNLKGILDEAGVMRNVVSCMNVSRWTAGKKKTKNTEVWSQRFGLSKTLPWIKCMPSYTSNDKL